MRKHKFGRGALTCLLFILFAAAAAGTAYADSAEVLPKGVFNIGLDNKFYLHINERYNPDGHAEDVAKDYNTDLDSSVFTDLALLEQFLGMPPGSANIGRSVVSFDYHYTISEFSLMYGVTDKLSIGVNIPYWWVKNKVKAKLDTSNATVGKNPYVNQIVPLSVPGTEPLTKQDVIDLLGGGLDINGDGTVDVAGMGYKNFGSWSDSGVADIEAGARYQYFKNDNWRLAATGGVRFPTGQESDPDSLVDRPFGTGAYALLLRLNNDYTGIRNFVLNTTFRYDIYFSRKETLRVPDSVNIPITTNKEKVYRNLGDVFEFETSGKYQFAKGWSVEGTYKFGAAQKDNVRGKKGYAYESLEDETNYTEHVYIVGLSYSTLPLYLEKKFPVPITASLSFRDRFAGTNNVLKSQYIGFGLQVYF